MYLRLMDGSEIDLPNNLDLQSRIDLCNKIIEEHEESFRYIMPKSNKDTNYVGTQASIRLELMGTYILSATKRDKNVPIMSEYKEKRIADNEINMDF